MGQCSALTVLLWTSSMCHMSVKGRSWHLSVLFATVDVTLSESFLNQLPDLGSCSEHFGSSPHQYYADYIK